MSKVYDLTQIFNELDLLEIRLNILDPYVDFFVIGESTQTFSGHKKPLHYLENKERFAKWNHKIIHHVMPEVDTDDVFLRTAIQKDSLRNAIMNCDPSDVVYYGDVDEIWKPKDVSNDKNYKMQQLNYCYYLNQRSSETWQGTNVCKYRSLINLNELRANHDFVVMDGGWHFTNMGGVDQILEKLDAYDHQEFNTESVRENVAFRLENNQDYIGRGQDWTGQRFEFWTDEVDLPRFLLDNKEKYAHLFR